MKNIALIFCIFLASQLWAGKPLVWEVLTSTANGSTFSHTLQIIDPIDASSETWVGDSIYSMHTDGTLRIWAIGSVSSATTIKILAGGNTSYSQSITLYSKVVTVPVGGLLPNMINVEPELAALLVRYFNGRVSRRPVLLADLDETDAMTNQIPKYNGTDWVLGEDKGLETVSTTARFSGAGTSGSPLELAQQSATSGQVLKWNGSAWTPAADNTGGLTNWTEAFSSTTQNNSQMVATNAAADVSAVVAPKGNGAFLLDVPDGASTGGNARGTSAVDLQITRTAAGQVASGQNSFVVGRKNTASQSYSMALGDGLTSAGTASFATGQDGSATGGYSAVFGYGGTTAHSYGFVGGGAYATTAHEGQFVRGTANQSWSTNGQNQWQVGTLVREITGTAQTELLATSSAGRLLIPSNRFVTSDIQIIIVVKTVGNGTATAGDTYHYRLRNVSKNIGGTTTNINTTQEIAEGDSNLSTGSVSVASSNTTDALEIFYTPPTTAGSTTVIRVMATAWQTQIGY